MAIKKRYADTPKQIRFAEDMNDRLRAIADREGISEAQVIRELVDAGIVDRERQSVRNYGS